MGISRQLYVHSVLFALVAVAAIGHSLELEYISPLQKQKLADDFEAAKLEKAETVLNKKWLCDMYGVRSRLQVQRDVKLYSLTKSSSGIFENKGAQVVSEYRFQDGVLAGQTTKFDDQLRITPRGQLISRLRARQPEPTVIAYSVCTAL